MRLVIKNTYDDLSEYVAVYVRQRILEFAPTADRLFVLGLPTGSSPLGTYRRLVEMHRRGELSFQHVATINMDEYVGLPRDHPQSYRTYMYLHFFQYIDIRPENVHFLDGNAPDMELECRAYEELIVRLGGIELFLGGIGPDGHIAFNEPGSSLVSRTRVKTLSYDTILANARFFNNDIQLVPKLALTVGIGTIMDARELLIIINGSSKAVALSKAIEEGVCHMWTVSAIQMHPRAIIVCDEDATLELKVKTVKYFKSIQEVQNMLVQQSHAMRHKGDNGVR